MRIKRLIKLHYKKIIISLLCITFLFSFVCFPSFAASTYTYGESVSKSRFYDKTLSGPSYVEVTYKSGMKMPYTLGKWLSNAYGYSYYVYADVPTSADDPIVSFDFHFLSTADMSVLSDSYFGQMFNIVRTQVSIITDCNLYNESIGDYGDVSLDYIEYVYRDSNFDTGKQVMYSNLGDKYVNNGRPQNIIKFDEYVNLGDLEIRNIFEIVIGFSCPWGAVPKYWPSQGQSLTSSQLTLAFNGDWNIYCYPNAQDVPSYLPPNDSTLNNALDLEGNLLDSVGGDLDELHSMFDDFDGATIGNRLIYKPLQAVRNILNIFVDDDLFGSNVFGVIITFAIGIGMAGFVLNLASNVISRLRGSGESSKGSKGSKGGKGG